MKDGKVELSERKLPDVSVSSLADMPVVGDVIHFRNDDDGPRGRYKVIRRALMVGGSNNADRIDVSIFIELER